MQPFVLWLAMTVSGFGVLAGGYHAWLTANPSKVVVVLESSYPMQGAWSRVPALLERIGERRYSEFALFTEKGKVHDFAPDLSYGKIAPYAPRDFSKLERVAASSEFDDATEVLLITNAPDGEITAPRDWRILRPDD